MSSIFLWYVVSISEGGYTQIKNILIMDTAKPSLSMVGGREMEGIRHKVLLQSSWETCNSVVQRCQHFLPNLNISRHVLFLGVNVLCIWPAVLSAFLWEVCKSKRTKRYAEYQHDNVHSRILSVKQKISHLWMTLSADVIFCMLFTAPLNMSHCAIIYF